MTDIEMTGCTSRNQAERLMSLEPRASIEAIITPQAAEMVKRAFESGTPIMLDCMGGPWIITRMENSGGLIGEPTVHKVWGTWTAPADYDWKPE